MITYERASTASPSATLRPKRPSRWVRLYYRFIAARQKAAMEELRRHALRLPAELEQAGWKLNERNEDSLPFVH
jgi:hypothetical protein